MNLARTLFYNDALISLNLSKNELKDECTEML